MRMSVWRGSARPQAGPWLLPIPLTLSPRRRRRSCASFATCISERQSPMPAMRVDQEKSHGQQQAKLTYEQEFQSQSHYPNRVARTQSAGNPGARCQGGVALVSARVPIRDVAWGGVEVWDVDGNRFLDFAAGIAVCSTGHSHPQVVQAIKNAADEFLHISPDFSHEKQIALGEKINALSPMGEPVLSFFCQSGTEAVEGALKLARYVSGRSRFIGFLGGFHGRTMGSLAFTASKCTQQQGFFSTMPGVTHVPYPNPYRPLFAGDDQGWAVLNYIENVLFVSNVPPNEVAAVLVEPIQCESGYVVPPDGFLAGLRRL